jgi:hypothetical protein
MTQRIFDIENEKDMEDLWDILPEKVVRIEKAKESYEHDGLYVKNIGVAWGKTVLKINWHDATEIARPVQEATEKDIGKLCMFSYPQEDVSKVIGILRNIKKTTDGKNCYKMYGNRLWYIKCRRLTKQEIEELC